MKRKFTFLLVAIMLLTMVTQPIGAVGQERTTFTGTFTKITSTSDFETGFYVITGSESASIKNKAIGSTVNGNGRIEGVTVTITSGTTISNPSDEVVFYVTKSNSNYTFKNVNTGKYMYQASTTSGKGMGFQNSSANITVDGYSSSSPIGFKFVLNGASNNRLKWNNNSSWFANYDNNGYTTSMSPVTLFKCPAYNVTYDANGGSGTMTDSNNPYASGATVTVKTNSFTNTGYNFNGWNTASDGSGTSYTEGATFAISANTTLYAQWSSSGNYITVDPTTATPTCAAQDVAFSVDTDQTLDENPTQFYTTSTGDVTTTKPAWIGDILYDEGELIVEVKQNKTSSSRTAYFRVEKGSVKSDVITITQAAFTLPAPSFDPESGEIFINDGLVELTSDTTGATIYYTMGENPATPTTSSTVYDPEEYIEFDETTTIKAIAVKYNISSAVATATYTVVNPLTTMDAIFSAATTAGGTAADTYITLGDWVVSGVSTDGKTAYVTDGSGKGFITYYNSGHGFAVGNVLSNTVHAYLKLYNGAAEFTNLTTGTSGIGVTTGGTVSAITNKTIADLSGVCTGGVYTLRWVL